MAAVHVVDVTAIDPSIPSDMNEASSKAGTLTPKQLPSQFVL